MKVCRVNEIRELDRRAIEEYGVPGETLMENAGQAVYGVIQREFGVEGKKFAVFCGPGNNGGDGFVVARLLHAAGGTVTVLVLAERSKYRGAALRNLEILSRFPVTIRDEISARQITAALKASDIVVDGLLGTGLDREVTGVLAQSIRLINESGKRVVAIDIASGVNGDIGQIMGAAIKADFTVTFGLPKVGNLLYPGFGQGGRLYLSHISYPQPLSVSSELKIELAAPTRLPPRRADTDKFSYGPALVIAGAANYFWAPHASSYSFLKAGGGYVYLACPASLAASVAEKGREVVIQPMQETAAGSIALKNKEALLELATRMRMVIIGPGLSRNEETAELVRQLAVEIDKPLLIDGDGISAVASEPHVVSRRNSPTILTPHTGEMARITGKTREQIEANRVDALQETAAKLKAYVVLKGPHSLIGYPDGRVFINVSGATGGRAGMATAGSGDVLNGTIAAMYCLGLDIGEAVRAGVFAHGLAGDLAARDKGPDGMTAQDILDTLPRAVQCYREQLDELSRDFYGAVRVV
jgi:NAD(P)H-hydrate epimerase